MTSLNHGTFNFNHNVTINFDGGNLSSDTGVLLPRYFDKAVGYTELINYYFQDNCSNEHTKADIIKQLIYTNMADYHQDDASDELNNDPIFKEALEKNNLASQPTISRRTGKFIEDDLEQLNDLILEMLRETYKRKKPDYVVLDIDSTYVETHGNQEETEFNPHYHAKGYHALVLFNGLTGDLLRANLRKGSVYTSDGAIEFLKPVLQWFEKNFPEIELVFRADSGFATSEIYELLEEYRVSYFIRLKANNNLYKASYHVEQEFHETFGQDYTETYALYESFFYQANSWSKQRRVACKVERKAGELFPRHHFVVTNLDSSPVEIFKAYQKRGNMENFIKEAKLDFGMNQLSHSSFIANTAKLKIKALAYNIINFMKRLVLPKKLQKIRMQSIRILFIKVASRFTSSGRYKKVSISSSYPYKLLFSKILQAVDNL